MTSRLLSSLAAAALLVAAFAALSTSSASASVAGKCTDKAKGTRVVLRTKTAVIFERKARTGPNKGLIVAFGCLSKKGANVLLGVDDTDEEIVKPTVAGNYAAFGQTFCFGVEDLCGVTVKVVDLRNGKVLRKADGFTGSQDADEGIDALVLSPRGAAGWISSGFEEGDDDLPAEVHALDASGARKLDTGAKLPAKSLTLSGSTLSWKNGAETRTATLA